MASRPVNEQTVCTHAADQMQFSVSFNALIETVIPNSKEDVAAYWPLRASTTTFQTLLK